jgi:hypothetical protein
MRSIQWFFKTSEQREASAQRKAQARYKWAALTVLESKAFALQIAREAEKIDRLRDQL